MNICYNNYHYKSDLNDLYNSELNAISSAEKYLLQPFLLVLLLDFNLVSHL